MMMMKMKVKVRVFFRFSTLEDCVAACGGGQPQERAECHQVIIIIVALSVSSGDYHYCGIISVIG